MSCDLDSISMEKKGSGEENPKKGSESQPMLTVIREIQGANECCLFCFVVDVLMHSLLNRYIRLVQL